MVRPRPHPYPDIFENATFFLRIGLPSTRKRWNGHRKRNFSKTVSKVELFKNAVFLFSCGRGSFWKRIKKVAFSNENGYVWTRPEIIDFISGGNINKNTLFLYNKYAYSVIFMAVLQNANSFKSLTCGIAASLWNLLRSVTRSTCLVD